MQVTLYHNPGCGTSRRVLGMLRERGIEPAIVEYLMTPPGPEELAGLIRRMGIAPRACCGGRRRPMRRSASTGRRWRMRR
jgi:arsenate reductase (glutaredoxin)